MKFPSTHRRPSSGQYIVYGDAVTDYHLPLAEEALSKIVREDENTKTLGPLHTEFPKHTQNAATPAKSISTAPVKTPKKTLEEVEKACEQSEVVPIANEGNEDSFVQEITCRSPAKPVTRIEDSVEALDNLEDALEALGEATLPEKIVSPKKTITTASPTRIRDSREYLKQRTETKFENKTMKKASVSNGQQTKPGYATVRARPTAPKAAPTRRRATSLTIKSKPKVSEEHEKITKAPTKRPISMITPREIKKSTKPVTVSTFELPGEAVARRLKEQREARLQRQSSEDTVPVVSVPKIKSTKPATKSTFELPGEAVSRRKREAHETRLKAQEEEAQRRREFKAKPVRASVVPSYVPRETAASLARRSKIEVEPLEDAGLSVSKRSSIVGTHRPSIQQLNAANISAPRAPGIAIPASRNPSLTQGTSQRVVSAQEIHAQRQRAKEIYSRDTMVAEDLERERLEREAAAKRAREEAAERGRQASREWAARQLAKKMADKTDRGLGPGYGPGGQLGLKS